MAASGDDRIRPFVSLYGSGVRLVLAVVAVVDGIVRVTVFEPAIGASPVHVVASLVTGIPAFLNATYLSPERPDRAHDPGAGEFGVLWLVATVVFEFGSGRYAIGHPWSRLLADYDPLAGRLRVLAS